VGLFNGNKWLLALVVNRYYDSKSTIFGTFGPLVWKQVVLEFQTSTRATPKNSIPVTLTFDLENQ
jgi:hypothetical protein